MSDFDDLRQEMAEELLDIYGVSATYTFEDSSTKTITVRLYSDVEIVDDSELSTLEHVVGINPDDIAAPKRGETVTIDGDVWTIGRRVDSHGGLTRYEVV